ncbi:hypothetical protein MferCBS49748_004870 [Microsporum ferrugineum]
MAEYLNEVTLGHLGKATYVEEQQEWKFSRAPNQGLVFKLASEPNVFSHGKNISSPCQVPINENAVTKRTEQMVLNLYPELTHGLSNMVLEEATSRAITSAASRFESNGHGCLAFGEIERMIDDRIANQTIPIMVCLHGNSSSSLTLCPYDFGQVSLPPGTEATIDDGQSVLWTFPGGPVQQVSSSESVQEQNKCFAARLSFSTTIFSPVYHRVPVPVKLNDMDNCAESYLLSKIDPNPLVNILCDLTGGHPHAAVAFNPWYQRQIALTDRAGNWSVWDLQRRQQRKAGWFAERGPSGSLRIQESEKNFKNIDHYDGWGEILWVGTIHQLLVCDRRNVSFCRIDVRPPKQEEFDLGLELPSEWILDVLRSQRIPSHVFILTTLRIFWLHIPPPEDPRLTQNDETQAAIILLSWRHFRDPEDISLQLTSVSLGIDFFIVLYSRLNLLAMSFQVFSSSDEPSYPVSICDARAIHLPKANSKQPAHGTLQSYDTVNFSSIAFRDTGVSHSPGEDTGDLDSPKLVAFVGQLVDGRLVECTYVVTSQWGEMPRDNISTSQCRKKRHLKDHTKLFSECDFIVEDGDKPLLIPVCPPNKSAKPQDSSRLSIPTYETREQWQHQYSLVIPTLETKKTADSVEFGNMPPFGDWLNSLSELVASLILAPTTTPMSWLMSETVPLSFSVDEAENIAKGFDHFIQNFSDPGGDLSPGFQIAMLPLPSTSSSNFSVMKPGSTKNFSLMELYDTMISHWLAPLPNGIPNRLRASNEKIIRAIISELCLAGVVISRCKAENVNGEREVGDEVIQRSGDISSSPFRAESLSSSQREVMSRNMLTCLTRYTIINYPRPISRKTATTTSHWAHGSDPNLYDWQATVSSQVSPQSENERNSKRRRRKGSGPSSSAGQSQRSVSADVPVARPWGSQPEISAVNPGIGSSQATVSGFTMTQVEHGVYGKRKPLFKAKKKRRIAGF